MILAVDVHYFGKGAVAAGALFHDWADGEAVNEWFVPVSDVAEYEPGQFYRRELPCILALLERVKPLPEYIIVDGYVYLDDARRPGIGKYLYDALEGRAAVIGVAKSRFKGVSGDTAVFRRGSKRPLYVTAVGLDETEAKEFIDKMHGRYRLPTMLRRVDRLSRG